MQVTASSDICATEHNTFCWLQKIAESMIRRGKNYTSGNFSHPLEMSEQHKEAALQFCI